MYDRLRTRLLGASALLWGAGAAFAAPAAPAAVPRPPPTFVIQEGAIFAVVTKRGGFASDLAHDHLVVAQSPKIHIELPGRALDVGQFALEVAADQLVVDAAADRKVWASRLLAAGVPCELGDELSEKDRESIRTSMLDHDQLNVVKFPSITAKVLRITPHAGLFGKRPATHLVRLALSVHGKTVIHDVPASIALVGDRLSVEAQGPFRFTDFGIEPVSLFFGAVKNEDEFRVYVSFVAARAPSTAGPR